MTTAEQVTSFVLRRDWFETKAGRFNYMDQAREATNCNLDHVHDAAWCNHIKEKGYCKICSKPGPIIDCKGTLECKHTIEMAYIRDLINALNDYLKAQGLEPEEYGFNVPTVVKHNVPGADLKVPQTYRWLISFVVEGGSEGYYIHLAAVMPAGPTVDWSLLDLGLAKTYSPESAYAIQTAAQRFLTAAQWN